MRKYCSFKSKGSQWHSSSSYKVNLQNVYFQAHFLGAYPNFHTITIKPEWQQLDLPMLRTKILGATTPERLTFSGMHASALLHWTEKHPPLTSNANSHESLAQHSCLQVFMLAVLWRREKSPASAPPRRVALRHSRPSLSHFLKSTFDFEYTTPANIDKRRFVRGTSKNEP